MLSVQARLLEHDEIAADSQYAKADGTERRISFLQSAFWASFKALHGWKPLRFELTVCSDISDELDVPDERRGQKKSSVELSVLIRSFKRFFSIAYIPMGPDLSSLALCRDEPASFWIRTVEAVKPFLPKNSLCLRFDPPLDFYSLGERYDFVRSIKKPLIKSLADIQPPDTTVLDLMLDEQTLLGNMKPKWRYNIRLAEKKGVVVREGGIGDIDVFYGLYCQTAKRDGIAVHGKSYYNDLLSRSGTDGCLVRLYIAEHENDALAAVIVLFAKNEAVYLYGASSNVKRNLMPAYLLQWTAVLQAKRAGCLTYDFYGMPPTDDEKHPMHGLYRFKTGFGGKIIHRPGSIDVPLSPLYVPFALAERLRMFYHKRLKKLFVRR